MNTYICKRDGNALEWRTHPTQPGGVLACWQCEQRLRNGLPLLPERVEPSIEAIRKMIWPEDSRYMAMTADYAEAKREDRLFNNRRTRHARNRIRATDLPHLDRVRVRPRNAEHVRGYWQQKAIQLGLGDVA